ncbi:hypothetical protein JST97_22675 [bacterium]|nr:hypothetical protein [bacterium]
MRLAALILALSLLAQAQVGPPAMVVAQKHASVPVFKTLELGERLNLPEGAQLTVSFLEGGGRSQCDGPGTFQVQSTQMVLLNGEGRVTHQQVLTRAAMTPRAWVNWDEMAGVRRDELAYCSDPVWLDPNVEIRWRAPSDVTQVEVVVEHLPEYRRVHKSTVPAESPLPLQLEAGQAYTVSLRGFSPRRTIEAAEQRLEVLSNQDRERLLAWESDVRLPEDRAELYSWLLSRGLPSRAQKMLPQLRADGAVP